MENLEYLLERTLRLVSLLRKRSIEASRNLLTPSGSSDQDGAWLLINMLLWSWTSCKEDRRRERFSFISENPRSADTEVVGALTMRSRSTKVKGHTSRMKASGCSATRRSRTVCRRESAIVFELRYLKGHTVDSIRVVLAV